MRKLLNTWFSIVVLISLGSLDAAFANGEINPHNIRFECLKTGTGLSGFVDYFELRAVIRDGSETQTISRFQRIMGGNQQSCHDKFIQYEAIIELAKLTKNQISLSFTGRRPVIKISDGRLEIDPTRLEVRCEVLGPSSIESVHIGVYFDRIRVATRRWDDFYGLCETLKKGYEDTINYAKGAHKPVRIVSEADSWYHLVTEL